MKDIGERIYKILDPEILLIKVLQFLPDILVAIATIIFFVVLWKVLKKGTQIFISKSRMDLTASSFLQTIIKYTILTIGFITALSQIGINITSILTSIGILGITIGFAAKDALSNIISGIFIFWDRPFVLNDLVEIEGQYGRVEEITLRSTRIVTTDGKMLAIPNNIVVNQIVSSYTNFPHLRIEIDLTVGVNEDLNAVRNALISTVANDEDFMMTPPPEMVVTAINDYNVAVQLRAWIKDERDHIRIRFELREKAFNVLNAAGIEMPFETFQLAPFKAKAEVATLN